MFQTRYMTLSLDEVRHQLTLLYEMCELVYYTFHIMLGYFSKYAKRFGRLDNITFISICTYLHVFPSAGIHRNFAGVCHKTDYGPIQIRESVPDY